LAAMQAVCSRQVIYFPAMVWIRQMYKKHALCSGRPCMQTASPCVPLPDRRTTGFARTATIFFNHALPSAPRATAWAVDWKDQALRKMQMRRKTCSPFPLPQAMCRYHRMGNPLCSSVNRPLVAIPALPRCSAATFGGWPRPDLEQVSVFNGSALKQGNTLPAHGKVFLQRSAACSQPRHSQFNHQNQPHTMMRQHPGNVPSNLSI